MWKISLLFPLSNNVFAGSSYASRLVLFFFGDFDTKHLFLHNYYSLHSWNKCWYLSFHSFWYFCFCQNIKIINSDSDTSILKTWLVNYTLHFSITVHHVCGNNIVASDRSQMLLRTIIFHISNICFKFHVISNYSVGNSPFSIRIDYNVMTDPTSLRLDYINLLPHQISNACSITDRISLSSVSQILTFFTTLKFKKVFIIHGFKFSYIILDNKLTSCIKDP